MELSVYPHDPDLPTLPLAITASVMGPQVAQLSPPLLRFSVGRCFGAAE